MDRLYLQRHEGGRGLISIEYCVRGEENSSGLHVLNCAEKLIQDVYIGGTIYTEGTISKSESKQQMALNVRINEWGKGCTDSLLGKCR